MIDRSKALLQTYFGYDSFRAGQEEVITSIMNEHHTLAIMPTGSGKSLCYQIPALLKTGVTIVVSPLISLMKDQVDSLRENGVAATYINSSLSAQEIEQRFTEAEHDQYKLLYLAPERIETSRFHSFVSRMPVNFVVFDEAHCISQWGHDFRPSYRSAVSNLKESMPHAVFAALTATATDTVKRDIQQLLHIDDDHCISTGFARPNLNFHLMKGQNKERFIMQYLRAHEKRSGIIYTATRKQTDSLYETLQRANFPVQKYHAGLPEDERKQAQQTFIHEDDSIMIATNAFGMGIDKSNVRYVIHYSMPMHMEAYYQEAGRAGRDGESSDCILLFAPQDIQLQKFLIEQADTNEKAKQQEYEKLQAMVNYCYTDACLTNYILTYFTKERTKENCMACSNCMQRKEKIDITTEAQMILSCVKRMGERFGVTLTAKVLRGSKDKRIKQFGFDRLTTYGILSSYTESALADRINFLIAEQFLSLHEGQFPTIALNANSVAVLKGEQAVFYSPVTIPDVEEVTDYDLALFESLRQKRKQLADEANIPPYAVFSDATLKDICRYLPESEEQFIAIKGIGQQKLNRYGETFMEIIRAFRTENPDVKPKVAIEPSREVGVRSRAEKTFEGPSHMETYRLYQNGKTIKDIANIRQLKTMTIENHLFQAYAAGHDLMWELIFTDEEEEIVLQQYELVEEKRLKPMKDKLPESYTYFKIKAVLVKNGLMNE